MTTNSLSALAEASGTMAKRKPAKKDPQKSAKSSPAPSKASKGFTEEERAAMREYVQERNAGARPGSGARKADEESAVVAKIAAMPASDRTMDESSLRCESPHCRRCSDYCSYLK